MAPFRRPDRTMDEEEDLWFRLDCALESALEDPEYAWSTAWLVARDADRYPDVRRAAGELMSALTAGA